MSPALAAAPYNLIREHVDAVSGPAVNVSDILPKHHGAAASEARACVLSLPRSHLN